MRGEALRFGPFELMPAQQLVTKSGTPLQVGGRALDLLLVLAEHAGEVVSKSDLMARAWPDMVVEDANLRMHIALLRKALGDRRDGARYVVNIPGRGYALVAGPDAPEGVAGSAQEAPPAISVSALPRRLSRVFGRSEAVATLMGHLSANRFVTVLGPGGIGKTTVALQLAHAASADYADGVHFVDLGPLRNPGLVPSALASALSLPVTSHDPTSGIVAFLREKRVLLVLDTCEHVLTEAALLVEALLTQAPGAALLATSREPLRADGEFRYRLRPLDVPAAPDGVSVEQAMGYPAVELFVDRARATRHDFDLDAGNVAAVVELCSRLDGLPLAIELAAARLDDFGVQGILNRLADRFLLLNEGRRTARPRQQTLRATCDWSYDLLKPVEQRVFRALGVFQGKFSCEAVSAALADAVASGAEVFATLRMLELKSLVSVHTGDDPKLFFLLDSVRAYAVEKLHAHGEADPILSNYGKYLVGLLGSAEDALASGGRTEWLSAHRHLLDDLRVLRNWARSSQADSDLYTRLADASAPLCWELALLNEQREVLADVSAVLPAALEGSAVEMRLHSALAFSTFYTKGLQPSVYRSFARGLTIAKDIGDTRLQLRTLWGLFGASKVAGQYEQALRFAEEYQALAVVGECDPSARSVGNRMMAMSLHYLGRHAEAAPYLNDVIAVSRADQADSRAVFQYDDRVTAMAMLARVRWLQGFPEEASCMAEASLEEAVVLGHEISLCFVLAFGACSISLWSGDIPAAERHVDMLMRQASHIRFIIGCPGGDAFRLRSPASREQLVLLRSILLSTSWP